MSRLPELPYGDGIRKYQTVVFGGYDHNVGARDGAIWDEQNMSGDFYPVMGPRGQRYKVLDVHDIANGICYLKGIISAEGTKLYDNGAEAGTLSDSRKQFAILGDRVVIFPDKKVYDTGVTPHTLTYLGYETTQTCTIQNGTYAGQPAQGNTIRCSNLTASHFSVGDAVSITGSTHAENNKTAVIREIRLESGYTYLAFYEHTFTNESDVALTISRDVPDLDYICACGNRIWGCKGKTVYASKLGDPTNWNVFDGVSTDSYAVEDGTEGDFTACAAYQGMPIFFKENMICKVYGSRPSNYQIMSTAVSGVRNGSEYSAAIAGDILYYVSRHGVMAYAGGEPQLISQPLGVRTLSKGVGGTDGRRYYLSVRNGYDIWELFVYDPQLGRWHREDETAAAGFCYANGYLLCQTDDGIRIFNRQQNTPLGTEPEGDFDSYVEFADFVEDDPNRKGTSKLQLRGEIEAGGRLSVQMSFDSGSTWMNVALLTATVKRSWYLPIVPRRSDHFRIRLVGYGQWKLHSLVRESYSGSEL